MTSAELAPLPVAVPLAVAAICAAIGPFVSRRVLDTLGVLAAAFTTVACGVLTAAAAHGTVVHWFGGWTPRAGVAIGIDFAIDPVGGALAAFAAFLTTAALLFAWTYYDESGAPFTALMLVFLAALSGFFLTGDIFNLFVLFELMSVAAYALTSYRTEDESALLGAFGFAVSNSLGAFLTLLGIALLYGRTGALNLLQLGHALGSHADALVLVAFAFVSAGLLVKAAVVPFHFWLSDAHAVAPTPLCVLFSGIMVQAGMYGFARVYWTVFAGALAEHEGTLRVVLLTFGLLTAFVGAVMCFAQRHFKRLLAFSTIAHTGIVLCAVALFSAGGLAGVFAYTIGHGLTKGALFMCSGILLNRLKSVDVEELRGALRHRLWGALAIGVGALALVGMPPFGTFVGAALIEDAARGAGVPWLPPVLAVASALTAGSVLCALGRMTFGWGPPPDPGVKTPRREQPEAGDGGRFPVMMYALAATLAVCACGVGFVRGAASAATAAAAAFVDRTGALAVVIGGAPSPPMAHAAAPELAFTTGIVATIAAFAFAALGLFGHRLPALASAWRGLVNRPLGVLHALHCGVVTDEVTWLAAGTAALSAAVAIAGR